MNILSFSVDKGGAGDGKCVWQKLGFAGSHAKQWKKQKDLKNRAIDYSTICMHICENSLRTT